MLRCRFSIVIFVLLALWSLQKGSTNAAPSCDEDCLAAKLETILNKLAVMEGKVDALNTEGDSAQHPAGCMRPHIGHIGHRRHFELRANNFETKHRSRPATGTPREIENGKCSETLAQICQSTGVSEVKLNSRSKAFNVLCDPDRWIVIMQRLDGSVPFHNKTWDAYKYGFGDVKPDGEFFVGLQHIHDLTFSGFFELRIDLEDFDGVKKYAHYSDFSIFNERGAYKLGMLGVYEGDAGDSFMYHEGQAFSTLDRDNDAKAQGSCGEEFNSAGWFKSCMEANLMGNYLHGEHDKFKEGMYWESFKGPEYSLKSVKMSIKAKC